MNEEQLQINYLLSRMTLFRGVSQVELDRIASDLELVGLEPGEDLFIEGQDPDSFFIVYSGKIFLMRERDSQEEIQAILVAGDHFGEESLLMNRPRPVTAKAADRTHLLRMRSEKFFPMIDNNAMIRDRLIKMVESRRLARERRVNWLGEEETIYLISRKDRAYLYVSLLAPLVVGWIGLLFAYLGYTAETSSIARMGEWGGLAVIVVALLWGIWRYFDWTNDYYLVTNHRVIWLEKVIALYESRQEAPLDTILTVGVNTDLFGRLLGYGDVRVKTYTGIITMRHIGNPDFMLALIEEFITRTKHKQKILETEALERAIRVRLGMPVGAEKPPPPLPRVGPAPALGGDNPFRFLIDVFKVRTEENGIVTYRKHWLLLVKRAWKPTLVILSLLVLLGLRFTDTILIFSPFNFFLVWFTAFILIGLWWLYEYIDWRNDIYQVTEEQIVDIYRRPLGEVDKKAAPLENILSLHHEQTGLIRLLLNYGDVVAMVGTARFTFDGVYNPAEVQQDIFLRMNARKRRQQESDAARERERVADWLVAYHRQAEFLDREEKTNNLDLNSG